MNIKQKIIKHQNKISLVVMVTLLSWVTWSAIQPFLGVSIWRSEPTITQAYGSGLLMTVPISIGWTALTLILLQIHKSKATKEGA